MTDDILYFSYRFANSFDSGIRCDIVSHWSVITHLGSETHRNNPISLGDKYLLTFFSAVAVSCCKRCVMLDKDCSKADTT